YTEECIAEIEEFLEMHVRGYCGDISEFPNHSDSSNFYNALYNSGLVISSFTVDNKGIVICTDLDTCLTTLMLSQEPRHLLGYQQSKKSYLVVGDRLLGYVDYDLFDGTQVLYSADCSYCDTEKKTSLVEPKLCEVSRDVVWDSKELQAIGLKVSNVGEFHIVKSTF
ncbi:hypothetical protein AB4620_22550, partial [Vibrio cyclitrophicus]